MTSATEVLLATEPRRRLILSPRPLGEGGQATVFGVAGDPDLVVKLYHEPTSDIERRLEGMLILARPDEFLNEDGSGHAVLTWPSALVEDVEDGSVIGYGMRRVDSPGYLPLGTLFNPAQRREHFPDISWRFLVGLARNLAGLTAALHERELVLGDVSHANLVVSQPGYLCFLDCDSMEFTDPRSGEHFSCEVLTAEYAPPELQRDEGQPRSPATDDFSLAVLVCRLLLVGDHPFMGIRLAGGDDDADVARNIVDGYSYLTRPAEIGLPAGTLDPALLPPRVLDLARGAFGPGHLDQTARPTAEDWLVALDDAMGSIRPCATHRYHAYSEHLDRCPWCSRVDAGATDVFPSPGAQPRQPTPATAPVGTQDASSGKFPTALIVVAGVIILLVILAVVLGSR
jgi:DNA-binding helix-hairpin-helix protein with protein kinase domain